MDSSMEIRKTPLVYENHTNIKFICLFRWLDTKLRRTEGHWCTPLAPQEVPRAISELVGPVPWPITADLVDGISPCVHKTWTASPPKHLQKAILWCTYKYVHVRICTYIHVYVCI